MVINRPGFGSRLPNINGFVEPFDLNKTPTTIPDEAFLFNAMTDLKETPEPHFRADLTGFRREEVREDVEEELVLKSSGERTVEREVKSSGERTVEREEKKDKWHRVERSGGKFRLPEDARILVRAYASMQDRVPNVPGPKGEVMRDWLKLNIG